MVNKKILSLIFISFILLTVASAEVPKLSGFVNDFADLLTTEEEGLLTAYCEKIEADTTVEVAVVTVKTTEGDERVHYANLIGEKTGVGKKASDNGVVILWSQENEHGGAIATGRGIESILNDAKVGRIGRESRQYFDSGQYYKGFEYILQQINNEVTSSKYDGSPQTTEQTEDTEISFGVILIIIILVILFIIFIAAVSDSGGDDDFSFGGSSGILSSGGSWSGSSGGFSFGGGSFGGGGSSF